MAILGKDEDEIVKTILISPIEIANRELHAVPGLARSNRLSANLNENPQGRVHLPNLKDDARERIFSRAVRPRPSHPESKLTRLETASRQAGKAG